MEKRRISADIPSELWDRLHAAAVWCEDEGTGISKSQLVAEGITMVLNVLEAEHNNGEPFAPRRRRLRPGPA